MTTQDPISGKHKFISDGDFSLYQYFISDILTFIFDFNFVWRYRGHAQRFTILRFEFFNFENEKLEERFNIRILIMKSSTNSETNKLIHGFY